jgi:hypothetical protein
VKQFKCVALSENRDSFGLRGAILLARDGEAWEVGVHDLDAPQVGKVYGVLTPAAHVARDPYWYLFGWEIPRRLPNAPARLVATAWPPPVQKNPLEDSFLLACE